MVFLEFHVPTFGQSVYSEILEDGGLGYMTNLGNTQNSSNCVRHIAYPPHYIF